LGLPDINGLEVIMKIRQNDLRLRIVVLSMHGEQEIISKVFKVGGDGFVPKSSAHNSLLDAIRVVMKGEKYIHPTSAVSTIRGMTQQYEIQMMLNDLSERELEVIKLTVAGYTRTDISDLLNISPKTVDTYRLRAMEKLRLENRVNLIQFALKAGLLDND